MEFKNVVVAGGGILGSQIAFQSAYNGKNVIILIRKEDSIVEVNDKLDKLYETYKETIDLISKDLDYARGISDEDFNLEECLDKLNLTRDRIRIMNEQKEALEDADLVIESITENFDIKANFYKEISSLVPERTVIVTNSSTLLPSKLAKYTGRSNKFLAMHFANSIWKNNIVEVMRHDETDDESFNSIVKYAEEIRMIPLVAKEEKSGYILNSMLVPFLLSAMDMLANGVSDPETIDKAWTLGTGAPKGPFQIIDTVGLETARNIVLQYQKVPNLLDPLFKKMLLPYNFDGMLKILDKYISEGKMGKVSGEGFYKY